MNDVKNILISIEQRHVNNLLNGTKTIELRRRKIDIPKGSKVWIYSKVPTGKVCAYGIVDYIYSDTPSNIWKNYGAVSGITKAEFFEYFSDRDLGCAIVFQQVNEIDDALPLNLIRDKLNSFHPPQFFKYLEENSPELELYRSTAFA